MPTEVDLAGLGLSPYVAAELGNQNSTLAGVGTSQTGAGAVLSKLVTLTTAGGQTAVVIPSGAKIGSPFWFANSSSTSALVFVPSGHSLNGSSNGSLTVAQNKAAVLMQFSSKQWYSILSA